ncbi:MAG: hypothetical protein FD130_196, partial [Halothiobacillaceae bacterium]
QGLLNIRSRGHFNRTLPPMEREQQIYWESGNYLVAVTLLVLLAVVQRYRHRRRARRYYTNLAV